MARIHRFLIPAISPLIVCLLLTGTLDAQSPPACDDAPASTAVVVTGTVSDSSAARVAGAAIVAACGVRSHRQRAGADGSFVMRLPAGAYLLSVEAPGFEPWSQELRLSGDLPAQVSAVLALPRVVDRVTVEGTAVTATTGSKLPVPVRRIPQSITVITRERMDEQNLTSVAAALDQMVGVQTVMGQVGGNSTGNNSVRIRGWYGGATQIDGFPSGAVDRYLSAVDTAMYERVEVLRGANGIFGGGGNMANPGGTINVAPKRPLDRFAVQGESTIGSWNSYRVAGDITGPLVRSGRVRARAVVALHDRDYFYDVAHETRSLTYATIEADLTRKTLLTVGSSYQRADATPIPGLPTYTTGLIDLPRRTSLAVDWGRQDGARTETFAKLAWQFRDGWRLNLTGLHLTEDTYRNDGWVCSRNVPVTSLVNICHYWSDFNRSSVSLDPHVTGSFLAGGLSQQITVGVNYLTQHITEQEGGDDIIGQMNVFAPASGSIRQPGERVDNAYTRDSWQHGAYGQTRVQPWRPLTVVLGGRISTWSYDNEPSVPITAAPTRYDANNVLTPYAGVVFDMTRAVSLYGSYTDVFRPHNRRAYQEDDFLPPTTGVVYETGVKSELFGGAFTTSLAFYRSILRGQPQADLDHPGFFVAVGEQQTEGIEVEAMGEVTPGWQLHAGYGLMLAETTRGTNAGQNFVRDFPTHTFRFWTRYNLRGRLARISLGGSIRGQSPMGTPPILQSAYAVADTQVAVRLTTRLSATVSINNLFDRTYFQTVGTRSVYYGEPRQAVLQLQARL